MKQEVKNYKYSCDKCNQSIVQEEYPTTFLRRMWLVETRYGEQSESDAYSNSFPKITGPVPYDLCSSCCRDYGAMTREELIAKGLDKETVTYEPTYTYLVR
jgi:hypothetical protein